MEREPRLIVCGGRNFYDSGLVDWALMRAWRAAGRFTIVHGGASGADRLAAGWAHEHSVNTFCYPAHWDIHGKSAGPIRNSYMLNDSGATALIAFPGGRGTSDMVDKVKRADRPIWTVTMDEYDAGGPNLEAWARAWKVER